MPTLTAYANDIHRWCDKLGVEASGQQEMVKDYIDTRWPTVGRARRQQIFERAMKPRKQPK